VINHEGFWWSKDEPHLPKPIALPYKWVGRKAFLQSLRRTEARIDTHKIGRVSECKGSSWCRICEEKNGSKEYSLSFMESIWEWPAGYLHYIKAHNVRPSQAFQEFIMAVDAGSSKVK
jgi:hypothetical protein